MRIIPYIIYLFILAFHYTILSELVSIYGVTIDLAVLMVTFVAIYKDELTAFWFAIAVGIVAGTLRLDLMPWEILSLTGFAVLINYFSTRVNLSAITTRMIILILFLIIHKTLIMLFISSESFLFILYRYILPGAVYSLIPGWIFFLIKDDRLTWKEIKAQF
jgi:cell shape-determining protein MreD